MHSYNCQYKADGTRHGLPAVEYREMLSVIIFEP